MVSHLGSTTGKPRINVEPYTCNQAAGHTTLPLPYLQVSACQRLSVKFSLCGCTDAPYDKRKESEAI